MKRTHAPHPMPVLSFCDFKSDDMRRATLLLPSSISNIGRCMKAQQARFSPQFDFHRWCTGNNSIIHTWIKTIHRRKILISWHTHDNTLLCSISSFIDIARHCSWNQSERKEEKVVEKNIHLRNSSHAVTKNIIWVFLSISIEICGRWFWRVFYFCAWLCHALCNRARQK